MNPSTAQNQSLASKPLACEVCGSHNLSELFPMEMMYGKGGPFRYVRCHDCESIYQPERLSDYGQYYPKSY